MTSVRLPGRSPADGGPVSKRHSGKRSGSGASAHGKSGHGSRIAAVWLPALARRMMRWQLRPDALVSGQVQQALCHFGEVGACDVGRGEDGGVFAL